MNRDTMAKNCNCTRNDRITSSQPLASPELRATRGG